MPTNDEIEINGITYVRKQEPKKELKIFADIMLNEINLLEKELKKIEE